MPDRKIIQIATRADIHNLVVDGSTDTAALVAPVASVKEPTLGTIIRLSTAPLLRFIFGAAASNDQTLDYQIIAWYKFAMPATTAERWFGVVIAQGTGIAGSLAIDGISGALFVDTIDDDVSTRTSVTSTLANHVAMLTVDTHNAKFLSIVTNLVNATKAYVWAVPGEFAR